MTHSPGPRLADRLEVHPTEDGLVIYQQAGGGVHYLNNTAAAILILCDGRRNDVDIAGDLAAAFKLSESPLAETRACLQDLIGRGLLVR